MKKIIDTKNFQATMLAVLAVLLGYLAMQVGMYVIKNLQIDLASSKEGWYLVVPAIWLFCTLAGVTVLSLAVSLGLSFKTSFIKGAVVFAPLVSALLAIMATFLQGVAWVIIAVMIGSFLALVICDIADTRPKSPRVGIW